MMAHSVSSWWLMARAMARSQMQYRANFLAGIVSMVLTYGGQFLSLYWLTERFHDIDGWVLSEVILLYALAILAWGVCVSLFFELMGFEEMIRQGTFDRALLRPMNPLLHVLGSQSPIRGMGQFVFSIAAFAWAVVTTGVSLTPLKLGYVVVTAIGGGLILGAAMITVAAAAFWTTRTYLLYWTIVFPGRQLVHYPISIYPRALQVMLTVLVPFAFINYFPAHVLLERSNQLAFPVLAWATPVVGVIAFSAAYRFWVWGAQYYSGTGS